MSLTLLIKNTVSLLGWLEGALIIIKKNLAIFLASEYSKVANLVKIYFEHNQKTPEDLFNYLNNKSSKHSVDHILLGFFLEHGIGIIPNLKKAFLEFQKEVNAKDSLGQFFLGCCYGNRIGTSQDQGKVFELYSKAAKAGNILAQNNFAICYDNKEGITKNSEKAFELYLKAAKAGNTFAQYNLAICYEDGKRTTKNSEKAFKLYSQATEVGHLKAQYNLALCYVNGRGTTKNSEKAFELYSKAAEAGDLNAQISLAICYIKGIGMTKNDEKAFELYLKAAKVDNTLAQISLASCYENRIGMTKNDEKAFELYSKAAKMGDFDAQISLASCYEDGIGMTKNDEKAFEFYSKAAETGSILGQVELRTYYLNKLETIKDHQNGWGTVKNLEETFQFYIKTAEAGNQNTQYNLEWSFELYLKAAEADNLCYQSDFPELNVYNLTLKDQNNLEYIILRFQNQGLKYPNNLKGEFLDFEAFFDQLLNEFKCFRYGNLGIIINGSPICPFCNTDNSYDNVFEAGLPKCSECDDTLKDSLWCNSYKVGEAGFGIVKKDGWKRDRILFWEKKNQKYEHIGITKVALKYIKDSQNIKYINSDEFIAHLSSASCKYIFECYGITKDVKTDEFIYTRSKLVHGDLHPGNILVLKTNPLKVVISDLEFCCPADDTSQSGNTYGVLEYLVPEICKEGSHTKYSNIYSFAIISYKIISGERSLNNIDPIDVLLDVIKEKRSTIKKHTPQCI
ncbi:hypothetical protein G9A89_002671 [Geosiphon pyriformis]|nr:hypothetical protein G9A89_002671 [Geosiphon pyriformis]